MMCRGTSINSPQPVMGGVHRCRKGKLRFISKVRKKCREGIEAKNDGGFAFLGFLGARLPPARYFPPRHAATSRQPYAGAFLCCPSRWARMDSLWMKRD